ncbi:TlpA family protein disulfide reductase [Aquabacterium humicola]|uniref:TlpA family protein disulfide reductase n=1 Tax=Aquabacterium humicola TaxID=3237377 RepID=UPI002542FF61|nr:TlpA disulfide reductase family protein [Rubrivivax pictus]
MTTRRQLLTGAVAGVAAAGGAGVAWWHRQADAGPDPLGPMWQMRFERPEGGELVMASLRGKPLLINFWATWCAPCLREMPEIDRFAREFAKRQGQVVGLAIDGPTPVREFLRRVKVGFTIGLGGLDGTDLVHQLGNLQGGLPFTVLIGPDGKIAQRKMGETSFDELQSWSRKI